MAPESASGSPGQARMLRLALLMLPPIVLVAVIWLPFGFRLGGLIEEWDVLGLFASHGLFFIASSGSPLAAHAIRPLTIFPQAIAYLLHPDSFLAWHLLNALFLVAKGAATGYLAFLVTRSAGWALACSVLVLVYPADTMQLAFRGLHINAALALTLAAACLAVRAHHLASRRKAAFAGLLAAALYLAACLMYEASLALLPLPLLVLLAGEGIRRGLRLVRARPELAALWVTAGLLCVLNAVAVNASQPTYQGNIGSTLLPTMAQYWPKLFSVGALRALVGGWYDAWGMLHSEYASYFYLAGGVLACGGAVLLARRLARAADLSVAQPGASVPRIRHAAALALCGAVLLLLGYAPYLTSPAHLAITQRTYLFATPGAAFVWLAALVAVAGASRLMAGAVFGVLLLLGLAAQLLQFHHYVAISEQQRTLLRSLVESAGDFGNRSIIVLDGSERLNHTWMLRGNLGYALGYLSARPVPEVHICTMPQRAWQRLDTFGRPGECVEETGGWRLRHAAPVSGPGVTPGKAEPDVVIPSARALVLRVGADGSVTAGPATAGYRDSLAHGDNAAARRYREVLLPKSPSALLGQFRAERETASYRTDFGRWWSLEEPIHGSGWREADWDIRSLHHDAAAWTVADTATLVFDLHPAGKAAVMHGEFATRATPDQTIQLRLNGRPVAARWSDPMHFEAELPPGVLANGRNVLEIGARAAPDYYGLGVKMTRFEITTR